MLRAVTVSAVALLCIGGGAVVPATAAAEPACTVSWTAAGNGNWERAASWSPARVPGVGDTACLRPGSVVRVNTSAAVRDVVVPSAQLAVAAQTVLTVRRAVFLDEGSLAGPGAVRLGSADSRVCCPSLGEITGPARLVRAVRVEVGIGVLTVGGRLGFSGGSLLTGVGRVELAGGAVLTDDDGDPANAFRPESTPAWSSLGLRIDGAARIEVPTYLHSEVAAYSQGAHLELPGLVDETSDGVLHGAAFLVQGDGRVSLPFAVTGLENGSLIGPGAIDVLGTGAPAFADSLRTVTGSVFVPYGTSFSVPVTLAASRMTMSSPWSVPNLALTDGSDVTIGDRLTLSRGLGQLIVRRDTAAGPTKVHLSKGAVINGDLLQQGGILTASQARFTHDWSVGAGATVALAIRWREPVQLPKAVVDGNLTLGGHLQVDYSSRLGRPPVGAVIRLLTVTGTMTGTFASVTLPPGYAITYDTIGVLVTRVS